jgi:PAS domain S-box-containing protein
VQRDNPNDTTGGPNRTLRKLAEAMVNTSPTSLAAMRDHDIQRLVHELQIHQVELELQNQQLRDAQMELASSRDRFLDLYDFAPVGYLTLDETRVIREANLTAATLLGVDRAQLPGSRLSQYIAPDCQDDAYLHWQAVFESTGKQICELELRRPDDKPVLVRLESIRFDGPDTPRHQCRVALIDIADVRSAQQALQSLNSSLEQRVAAQVNEIELMAKALANLGEGVLITTDHQDWLASRIAFVNTALCDMLGFSPDQILRQSPGSLLKESIDPTMRRHLQAQLVSAQSFRGELLYHHRDGSPRTIELLVSPFFDIDRQCTNYVAVARDISERKSAEQLLYKRKEQLRSILNTVPDCIITIDLDGIVQDCNSATERLFGYSNEELVGQNVALLMPSPHREAHDSYLRRYRDTGKGHIIGSIRPLEAQHRNGQQIPIVLSVNEIDHLGLYLGVIHDASELRRVQRELLRAADDVQWKIGQALHDGPQQALAGLSLISSGLARELRQLASPLEAQAQRLSTGLREANASIRELAQGLVPMFAWDEGLNGALRRLAQQVNEVHGIQCELIAADSIQVDDRYTADQLYHIAREAVLNAVNHSGGDRVSIHLERQQRQLVLRVVDNGGGLDRDKGKPGLGMFIMPYRAATIHGELKIIPAQGGGTEVYCTLMYPQHDTPLDH